MKKNKILIVEDDIFINRTLTDYFSNKGFIVYSCYDSVSATNSMLRNLPDIVILDINLPTSSGLDLVESIKSIHDVPVIFYTSSNGVNTEIRAFELGGNDFVNKSRGADVLYNRVILLLGNDKSSNMRSNTLTLSNLKLDYLAGNVFYLDEEVKLSTNEFNTLYYLVANKESIVNRDELSSAVRGQQYDGASRGIDLLISRIRTKLSNTTIEIKSVRGKGYRIKW